LGGQLASNILRLFLSGEVSRNFRRACSDTKSRPGIRERKKTAENDEKRFHLKALFRIAKNPETGIES
jgi:hypothetical protein